MTTRCDGYEIPAYAGMTAMGGRFPLFAGMMRRMGSACRGGATRPLYGA